MPVRRSHVHGQDESWSSIALHLEPAEPGQEGFYLTLFPDGRPPATVFLRGHQVALLLDMAASSATTDQAIWDVVAKIPLEPLLPSRTLATRLRALLVDCGAAIREQARRLSDRRPAAMPEPAPHAPVETPPAKPPWSY